MTLGKAKPSQAVPSKPRATSEPSRAELSPSGLPSEPSRALSLVEPGPSQLAPSQETLWRPDPSRATEASRASRAEPAARHELARLGSPACFGSRGTTLA